MLSFHPSYSCSTGSAFEYIFLSINSPLAIFLSLKVEYNYFLIFRVSHFLEYIIIFLYSELAISLNIYLFPDVLRYPFHEKVR